MTTADYIAIGVLIVLAVRAAATQFPVRSSASRVIAASTVLVRVARLTATRQPPN
jgi:hypothetical protein